MNSNTMLEVASEITSQCDCSHRTNCIKTTIGDLSSDRLVEVSESLRTGVVRPAIGDLSSDWTSHDEVEVVHTIGDLSSDVESFPKLLSEVVLGGAQ